jgi:hypothetical protein
LFWNNFPSIYPCQAFYFFQTCTASFCLSVLPVQTNVKFNCFLPLRKHNRIKIPIETGISTLRVKFLSPGCVSFSYLQRSRIPSNKFHYLSTFQKRTLPVELVRFLPELFTRGDTVTSGQSQAPSSPQDNNPTFFFGRRGVYRARQPRTRATPKNALEGVARKWRYFLLISNISLSHAYLTGTASFSIRRSCDRVSLHLEDPPVLLPLANPPSKFLHLSPLAPTEL